MQHVESVNNSRVKTWRKLHTKKERDKRGLFLIEGYHLIEEALASGMTLTEMIVAEDAGIPEGWLLDGIEMYNVPIKVLRHVCETEHPQGVVAVCRKLENELPVDLSGQYLLVDAVQDPGNVGTMIRTADAAGMSGVILGKGCADLYNGKTLRATQGSLFHIPVIEEDLSECVEECRRQNLCLFGTTPTGAKPYTSVTLPGHFALIVGNEGSGVDPALLEKTDERLFIPLYGAAESLNVSVATGILVYGLKG